MPRTVLRYEELEECCLTITDGGRKEIPHTKNNAKYCKFQGREKSRWAERVRRVSLEEVSTERAGLRGRLCGTGQSPAWVLTG